MENIKQIESFMVDHKKIVPGIYISRKDDAVVTYDMRTRKPNSGDYMDNRTMHSFEHMFATYIRNSSISSNVLYFGPMGCQTGFYLLVRNLDPKDVLKAIIGVLKLIIDHDGEMFGASETECGNYRNLSLKDAQEEGRRYLEVLLSSCNNFSYPK